MQDAAKAADADDCQSRFARYWGQLRHPAVRALAWLLDSPDLLDAASPHWQGRIATLERPTPAIAAWLAALDADPAPLEAALGSRPHTRLGLYAEKLMAFYFAQQGQLAAHGVQVRDGRNGTVGEFDFLLHAAGGVRHIEFATKFYLLDGDPDHGNYNRLVGPNLADTLGLKMRKIFRSQLLLAEHPAAAAVLPAPVVAAQALVKGWLFYHAGAARPGIVGVNPAHCHGSWRTWSEQALAPGERFIVMPRMLWLAPLRVPARQPEGAPPLPAPPPLARQELLDTLAEMFAHDPGPVLVATVREEDGWLEEVARGFVVPDDWRARAKARRQEGALPA